MVSDSYKIEFTKCVLKNGSPNSPRDGQWVKIDVKKLFNPELVSSHGSDPDAILGFKMDPGENTVTSVRIRLGCFETLIGEIIHRAVGEMKLAEMAHISFEIDPKLLNETVGRDDKPEIVFIDLKFEITLVEIEDEASQKSVYQLDENSLLEMGLEHKNDANRLFKSGRLITAFKRYKKSIDCLIIAEQIVKDKIESLKQLPEDLDPEELSNVKQKILTAKAQIYSNLALCQIKSKSFDLAIQNCSKCLLIDGCNVKALFRRGQAKMCQRDYDQAIDDFKRALELEPDNQDVRTSMTNCEKLRKDYEKALASNLKKLFT